MKLLTFGLLLVCVHTKLMHCLAGEDFFLAFDLACRYQKTSLLNEFYMAIEVAALEFICMNFSILKRL